MNTEEVERGEIGWRRPKRCITKDNSSSLFQTKIDSMIADGDGVLVSPVKSRYFGVQLISV